MQTFILKLIAGQLALAILGWLWLGWFGTAIGVMLGSTVMVLLEGLRGRRLIQWMREPDLVSPPSLHGQWGEVAYRAMRALRYERERARESTQRLDDFLAAIQASPNGVILLDDQGRIEWCNEAAGKHFGIDTQRDILQHVGNLVREPTFTAYLAGNDFSQEVHLIGREDSPLHPVRLAVQLHPYGRGHRLMLSRNVTALVQADATRRDFIANVSHELRTPLTVLAGFVESLQTLPLSQQERAKYLDLMATQSARMEMLIQDLLTLSRLEGSPPPGEGEMVNLGALMMQCEVEARGLSQILHPFPEQAQTLRFAPVPSFALKGSFKELHSAVSNLVNNAVRYTPSGGTIDVHWLRLDDGRARLSVSDTGPGIAPEHLARLGERFYRVDRSRSRDSGGTGLGLAITKHVAQRHGGELQVRSTLGQGSCFALVFPSGRVCGDSPEIAAIKSNTDVSLPVSRSGMG